MIIVSDASPIVALHHLALLGLLGTPFRDILVNRVSKGEAAPQ